jgi:hypothetical protein
MVRSYLSIRTLLLLLAMLSIFVLLLAGCSSQAQTPTVDKWVKIFNGKDLTGWTPKFKGYDLGVNYKNTFRVKDGLLKVSYDEWEEFGKVFGHIFYKDSYSHYKIRLEYRFVGEQIKGGPGWAFRNNGIMLHGQKPETMAMDQSFPVSIEVQLLGGNGTDERSTGNLCTPGTNVVMNGELLKRHCTNSTSPTFHGDQWVKAEVELRGRKIIKHFINGEQVLEYEQPQYDEGDETALPLISNGQLLVGEGTISLQAETHPTQFRNIEIMLLEE